MKTNYLLIPFLVLSLGLNSQVLLSEDFSTASGTTPPTDWNNMDLDGTSFLWSFENEDGQTLAAPITHPAAIFDSNFASEDGNTEDVVLDTPEFDASTGTIVLEFDHAFYQSQGDAVYTVEVWDGNAWNDVLTGDEDLPNDPMHAVIDITAATGNYTAAKVRFHWTGSWDLYWIVDNVKISRVTCLFPTNLAVANVTAHTANISWTAGDAETNWNIEYGIEGFTPGTGTATVATASGTSAHAFSTLAYGTDYAVYIQADCGGGDVSPWVGPILFSTPCEVAVVSTYPWTENFDGASIDVWELPCSWVAANENNDTISWGTLDFFSNSGIYSLTLVGNENQAADDWAYTPGFAMVAGTTYQLKFDYIVPAGAIFSENLTVYIGNAQTSASMTTQLDDLAGIFNPTYVTNSINFTVPATGTYYIGLHGHSDPNQGALSLDNFKVDQCPACPLTVEENTELAGIEIYPNPSKGLVHVTSPASNGTLNVSVVDFAGKEALVLPGAVQGAFEIDLSAFDNGVYFVKFLSENAQSTQRIVVTK